MIDTIAILLLRGDTTGNWDIEQMANRLDEDTTSITTYNNGSSTINGMIKNMKVYITPYYVKVIGSLNKYYCGNNLETLAQDDIVDAIVLLSEDLELPLERGFIRRIDVARNIVVKKNVEDYINSFDETDGYHKIDERVLYKKSNARHSMTIYDKVKELKANDRELYQYNKNGFLKNKKILRFEVKLERQLKQQLKYKSVRVVHLRSKSFLKN